MPETIPANAALLVVDLQNDFTQATGKAHACVEQVDLMIPIVNQLIASFQQAERPVLCVKTAWKSRLVKLLSSNSVQPGTQGADWDERIQTDHLRTFTKPDKDIFSSNSLRAYLQTHNIQQLYLCGLAIEHCLRISYQSAQQQGFQAFLVKDAVAAYRCHDVHRLVVKYFPNTATITSCEL